MQTAKSPRRLKQGKIDAASCRPMPQWRSGFLKSAIVDMLEMLETSA
jgi:hypothetical protein